MSPLSIIDSIVETVVLKLPSILLAILVLFVGWILARLLARLVGRIAYRLTHSTQVKELVDDKESARVDLVISRITYYVLIIFVLVEFFDVLGVTAVRGPFMAVANELALAIPNVAKAVLILLAAWLIGTLLRGLTGRILRTQALASFLDRMQVVEGPEDRAKLTQWASNLVYYLVLLMFLPAFLSALQLEGLQEPLEQVVAQAFGFLPNLASAAVIVLIGFLVTRVVRVILTRFLAGVGVDELPAKVGLEQLFATHPLSRSLGTIAVVLIWIPLLISALDALGIEAISAPAISMLTVVLNAVPSAAVALLLLAAGLMLARWVGQFTTTLLESARVAGFLAKWRLLPDEKAGQALHSAVGKVVAGIVWLLILAEVFEVLHLEELSAILGAILAYLPHVAVGVAVLAVGYAVSEFVYQNLLPVLKQAAYPVWLALVARYAILTVVAMMALEQLGVAEAIVVNAFTILLGSLGLGLALALGLGAKDVVQRWVERGLSCGEQAAQQSAAAGESKQPGAGKGGGAKQAGNPPHRG